MLVQADITGMYVPAPKFAKVYTDIGDITTKALEQYVKDVTMNVFPDDEKHTYPMAKGEEEVFLEWCAMQDAQRNVSL